LPFTKRKKRKEPRTRRRRGSITPNAGEKSRRLPFKGKGHICEKEGKKKDFGGRMGIGVILRGPRERIGTTGYGERRKMPSHSPKRGKSTLGSNLPPSGLRFGGRYGEGKRSKTLSGG